MTGSLQVKRGKYYAVINFKDETAKRVVKWFPLYLEEKGNKRKAEMMLKDLIVANKDNEVVKSGEVPLFTDYIEQWLKLAKGRIEKSTWESYSSYTHRHIIPYFELLNLRVDKVTATHIKGYYDFKSKGGRLDKKAGGMSYESIKNHSKVLKQVLENAVIEDYQAKNVALRVPIPKVDAENGQEKAMFLDATQANVVLAAFQGHRLQPLLLMTLYYGLRRSEVIGLKWDAVDFHKNTIAIKHVIVKTQLLKQRTEPRAKHQEELSLYSQK